MITPGVTLNYWFMRKILSSKKQSWLLFQYLQYPVCALKQALYTCFIYEQGCKWCPCRPKLTLSVILDIKSIIYFFFLSTVNHTFARGLYIITSSSGTNLRSDVLCSVTCDQVSLCVVCLQQESEDIIRLC